MKPNELDQSIATQRDLLPRLWWGLYNGCLEQGFSEHAAFSLVETYILGLGNNIVPPPNGGRNREEI